MQRFVFWLLSVLVLGVGGCSPVVSVSFDLTREMSVPGSPDGDHALDVEDTQPVATDGLPANAIHEARVEEVSVEILHPAEQDLDFLEGIEVRLRSDTQGEELLASLSGFEPDLQILAVDGPGSDIAAWLREEELDLEIAAYGTAPAEETRLQIRARVRAVVELTTLASNPGATP